MTDYRDFDEPYGDKGGPPSEKSTRWILIICFGTPGPTQMPSGEPSRVR